MGRMSKYRVLLTGLTGPGVEAAKNIILAGVQSVTLHDPRHASWSDLASNFYLREEHVGTPRGRACVEPLRELNEYVRVAELEAAEVGEADIAACDCLVAVDQPRAELIRLARMCRALGKHLVATGAHGLFGFVFVDLGDAFVTYDANGETPREGVLVDIRPGDSSGELVVLTDPDRRHDLADGDRVTFTHVEGATELNDRVATVRVVSASAFAIKIADLQDAASSSPSSLTEVSAYKRGGYWRELKSAQTLNFRPLEAYLGTGAAPIDGPINLTAPDRPAQLHALLQALWSAEAEGSSVDGVADRAAAALGTSVSDADRDMMRRLAATSNGKLSPLAACLGGVAGQEVLKAAGGRFTPLQQWLYVDAAEALPVLASDRAPRDNRYDGQAAVFGWTFQEKLAAQRVFVVGAGALGCEFLKSFALMGIGAGAEGQVRYWRVCVSLVGSCSWSSLSQVTVTDMDRIERSNLNRQFLFRTRDIGQPKSVVAAAAALRMNPALKLRSIEARVAPDTTATFPHAFWSGLSFVTNALDNVEARKYVDSRCVEHRLPLLESGTLGTKCNTLTCLPGKTLSYASEEDPADESIPVCTLKSFPYLIEHTLQWARDAFEDLFVNTPQDVRTFAAAGSHDSYLASLRASRNQMLERVRRVHAALVTERCDSWGDCVRWARVEFERLFVFPVLDLLHQHPEDKRLPDGTPFWTAKKRPPTPAHFSLDHVDHRDFVLAAAAIRARLVGISPSSDATAAARELESARVPAWSPSTEVIPATEEEAKELAKRRAAAGPGGGAAAASSSDVSGSDLDAAVERMVRELPTTVTQPFAPEYFEKDDDGNGHLAMIAAAGNIRAQQYRIPEVDRTRAKGIVGRIIPAIATTTALTTGIVGLEMFKLVAGLPLEAFRNANHNLAINQYATFEPPACPKRRYRDTEWTLWDVLELGPEQGVSTLGELLEWFEEREMSVTSISTLTKPVVSLYSGLPDPRLEALTLRALYEKQTRQAAPTDVPYVLVAIEAEDEADPPEASRTGAGGAADDEEEVEEGDEERLVDLPPVRLFWE